MQLKLITFSLLFTVSASATTKGVLEAWKGFSAPEIMASGFKHNFKSLPLEGQADVGTKNWSSSYWPSFQGGINNRWNTPEKVGFNYSSPSKEQVKNMSLQDLAKLSPSEKYDLLLGDYSYPMKKRGAAASDPGAPDWAGICHGWAPASLRHNEPTPKVLTNPDGIQIPFGSADIKGLLSFYYAFDDERDVGTNQVGLRCFFGGWLGGARACGNDLNAGAFHIIISNMLGLRKEGFLGDVDRLKEVWNQPIQGYKSKVVQANLPVSSGAAKNAVSEMIIATEFFYVNESENLSWDLAYGTKEQIIAKKDYLYRLELDAGGNIVGGKWETKEMPDFLWNKTKTDTFTGILSRLPELLND